MAETKFVQDPHVIAVSSTAVNARSTQYSFEDRLAQHGHFAVLFCSSVSRCSAVLVASSLSLATKRVSRSTAACQHLTCLFAWQQPPIISRTGLIISRICWQKRSGRLLLNSISDQAVWPKWYMGRTSFGGRSPIAFLVSTSVHAVQDLEGRPSLLQRRRRKKRRKRRSQSRASQAMKWPLKRGQNAPNGKPTFGISITTSG